MDYSASLKKSEPEGTSAPVVDLVCGMTVKPHSGARSFVYDSETYYFCSTHCLQKFREEPERFTKKSAGQVTAMPVVIKARKEPANWARPSADYTCPMHSEVRSDKTGPCPKCGMALEPFTIGLPKQKAEYTCPMHPEIVRDGPGNCPICGMVLEPRTVSFDEEENHELQDMRRRFWVSVVLTIPVFLMGMSEMIPESLLQQLVPLRTLAWIQLALTSPVVLWGGWPFFVRGWQSVLNRSLNMFTLIGLGVAVAYLYSVIATIFPDVFPHSFRGHSGSVPVYFEAAAVITTLVLLG